jgi:hypothetical protein
MVVEHIRYTVPSDRGAEFEAAYADASASDRIGRAGARA